MASTSKGTPKKLYTRSVVGEKSSSCRLCNTVVDRRHSKDLFSSANHQILNSAQIIYGQRLRQDNVLPHLICRPCERRVNNFAVFKKVVEDTQKSLESSLVSKRCLELSPSLPQPAAVVRAVGTHQPSIRRRSLEFDTLSSVSILSNCEYAYLLFM